MKKKLKQPVIYKCTECKGDATVAMTMWKDSDGNSYIKKGERLCMPCTKKRTGHRMF